MRSMTGYAHSGFQSRYARYTLEIKSYNNRYLELYVNVPSFLQSREFEIRGLVQDRLARGKVELNLRVSGAAFPVTYSLNRAALSSAHAALDEMRRELGLKAEIQIDDLLKLEGVLQAESDSSPEGEWELVKAEIEKALSAHEASCLAEGNNLSRDILGQLDTIKSGLSFIKAHYGEIETVIISNLKAKATEIAGEDLSDTRLMQELAIALTKFTVNEEVKRLESHLDVLEGILKNEEFPGKKIDFYCQEMNREVNTIGSKNQLAEFSPRIVEMKTAIENIREQARNIA
jgi:uncharacterized protein (TIGR00255 family)